MYTVTLVYGPPSVDQVHQNVDRVYGPLFLIHLLLKILR